MLEACLRNKVIRDFLNLYKQSRWQKLIPSLIEIAILNLNSSFNTLFFSEEDIHSIIEDLKINQNKKNGITEEEPKKQLNQHIIFSKPSNEWRTADGGVEPIKSNFLKKTDNKDFLFDSSSISNNNNSKYNNSSKYSHNRKNSRDRDREIAKENIINKKMIKNTKSKIREQVELDKKNYYGGNRKFENENYKKPINQIEKINYAISYDKNLQPELIEKTTINKNKKGGKKIIQKMTQKEYEQQFAPEHNIKDFNDNNNDNYNEVDYEEGENEEQNYEENEEEDFYDEQNDNFNQNDEQGYYEDNLNNNNFKNKNINYNNFNNNNNYENNNINNNQINNNQNIQNIQNINNQIKKKNNLYHYKTDFTNQSNNIIIDNLRQGNNNNYQDNNNIEAFQNPQQSFNPQYFKSNNNQQNNNQINAINNNYINIENNTNEQQNLNNDYNYNPNPSSQYNINNNNISSNFRAGISESEDKNSKLIGIDQKYQKKIDELEKNILKNEPFLNANNVYKF